MKIYTMRGYQMVANLLDCLGYFLSWGLFFPTYTWGCHFAPCRKRQLVVHLTHGKLAIEIVD